MLFYLENCEKCNTDEIDSDPTPEIQALYNEYIHIWRIFQLRGFLIMKKTLSGFFSKVVIEKFFENMQNPFNALC